MDAHSSYWLTLYLLSNVIADKLFLKQSRKEIHAENICQLCKYKVYGSISDHLEQKKSGVMTYKEGLVSRNFW